MANGTIEIVGLGEILWDLLPGGRQLGGAPFNFTFQCHQLGHPSAMVSRVGNDEPGRDIRTAVRGLGLAAEFIQEDPAHPTGTVAVAVGAGGQPTFSITPEVAYDYLDWNDELELLLRQAQAVCFGTLVQRHPVARATVRRALRAAHSALTVYDVNLRQDFYDRATIEESLQASRWVKLNDDELAVLRDLLGLKRRDLSGALAELRRRYGMELACLTFGARGCIVQTADEEIAAPGVRVPVVDTVGAGDAFTAGLLVYALEQRPLAEAAAFANRLAARVAGAAGGTPLINRAEVETSG